MAMSTSQSKGGAIAEINVTPMADVMIVLLIIFMVTVPLIKDAVPLPAASHARPDKEQGSLVVVLQAKGDLVVDNAALGPYEPALPQLTELARAASRPVWIKADRAVPYKWIGAVLEACRRGGAEDVYLATNPPEVQG